MSLPEHHLIAEKAVEYGACQKRQELAEFLDILSELNPEVIVEIGSYSGGTLYAWQRVAPNPLVIGMDIVPSDPTFVYQNGLPRGEHGAKMIIGDSRDQPTRDALLEALDGRLIDCLFIDGDHTYEGVRSDYEMYRDLVRPGGLIALHDIVTHNYALHCEVVKLWCEIKDESAIEIVSSEGDHWGGIGVLRRGDDNG